DKIIIFSFFPAKTIGLYVVAASAPSLLIQLYSKASQDAIFVNSNKGVSAELLVIKPLIMMTSIFAASIAGSIFFGSQLIVIVFGAGYLQGAQYLPYILTFGFLFSAKEMLVKVIKPFFVTTTIKSELLYLFIVLVTVIFSGKESLGLEHMIIMINFAIVISSVPVVLRVIGLATESRRCKDYI
ncbi:hypothetical protein OAG84_04565, partial [Akkermansiaceae bacterium]|nr:hypothetical protein [Akkermansiaceae bacterium]